MPGPFMLTVKDPRGRELFSEQTGGLRVTPIKPLGRGWASVTPGVYLVKLEQLAPAAARKPR